MKNVAALVLPAALAVTAALAMSGRTDPPRSPAVRAEFQRQHPCPATGARRGACPGWVADHRVPLCAGGADSPANMQWITAEQARRKDPHDIRLCAAFRRDASPAR